jgi:hypothetical protein
MAKPGHECTQIPQPVHVSKSMTGRAFMSSPMVMALKGQLVSHGLHGISV